MRAVFANKRAAYLLDHDGTLLDRVSGFGKTPTVDDLRIRADGQLLRLWFSYLSLLYPMWPNETFKLRIRQGNKRASAEVHV